MQTFDLIGVGFGPSNISLAIQLQSYNKNFSYIFFEQKANSNWQDDMLIKDSDIQNNPIRDLVSLVNPRSKYSFINYLFETDKLHIFLNTGRYYPIRKDYSDYRSWCASDFKKSVKYNTSVQEIALSDDNKKLIVKTGDQVFKTNNLVLGCGRSANIPKIFQGLNADKCFHLTKYLSKINKLVSTEEYTFTIVGASQSSVEIAIDLYKNFPKSKINIIIRNFSFKLKDTSPFSYEIYFPENIDFFYNLNDGNKEKLRAELRRTNYSSVDKDILCELYKIFYIESCYNERRMRLFRNSNIQDVEENEAGSFILNIEDQYDNSKNCQVLSDFIILATGFNDIKNSVLESMPILSEVTGKYRLSSNGSIHINRDYSLEPLHENLPNIYLSGLCETSHGLGDAGSFSLIPVRNKVIIQSIINKNFNKDE